MADNLTLYRKTPIDEVDPKSRKNKKGKSKAKEPQNEELSLKKIKEIYSGLDDSAVLSLLRKNNNSIEDTLEMIVKQQEKMESLAKKRIVQEKTALPKELIITAEEDEQYLQMMMKECEESFCYYSDQNDQDGQDINKEQMEEFWKEVESELTEGNSKPMDLELRQCIRKEISVWMAIQAAYEEENNLDEINAEFFDDNPELLLKLQCFIEDLIGKDIIQEKKQNKMLNPSTMDYMEGFPDLNNVRKTGDRVAGFNCLQKIEENNEVQARKRQDEQKKLGMNQFLNFRSLNNYEINSKSQWEIKNKSLFHTSKENSQEEVQKLAEQFPDVELKELKFIYSHLSEDFEVTRNFLRKEYRMSQKKKKQIVKKPVRASGHDNDSDEEVGKKENKMAELLSKENYETLRDEIKYHMSMKYIFSKTARDTASFGSRHSESSQLKSKAKEHETQLLTLMAASKKKFLDKLQKETNLTKIDLHGFYLEEALDILHDQIKFIKSKIRNKQLQNYNTQEFNGQKCLIYEIITGKGIHSQNRKPILTPGISKYLKEYNYLFRTLEKEGKIYLYFQL